MAKSNTKAQTPAAAPALVPRETSELTPEVVAALEPIERVLLILSQADLTPKPTRENAHEIVHGILQQYVALRASNQKFVSTLQSVDTLIQATFK